MTTCSKSLNGEAVEGQLIYSESENKVTFLPKTPLEPSSVYKVAEAETYTSSGEVTAASERDI